MKNMGEKFVDYLNGIFSIAVWDGVYNKVILARDRIGIKPLYYCIKDSTLIFASEIKSLLNCKLVEREVNLKILGTYLQYRYIPGEQTMIKDIYKLMPGHILSYDNNKITLQEYWDINIKEHYSSNKKEYHMKNIKDILSESIKSRIGSESNIGILLSGGLDSTIILSEASKICTNIKTFSVSFEKPNLNINTLEYDEMNYSREVAKIYGSEHHEYKISSREVIDNIEKIIWHMDEPISDPTSIPLYFVSKLAREHSNVVLCGEGADEIFGGYNIYKEPHTISTYLNIPQIIRRGIIEKVSSHIPLKFGKDFLIRANKSVENRYRGVGLTFRDEEVFNILKGNMSRYIVDTTIEQYTCSIYKKFRKLNDEDKMMYFDQKVWLPEDVLIKSDKMSMANSIKLRIPFLDCKLVDYLADVPFDLKIRKNCEKYILKETFKNDIPEFVINRKKSGFPVPISAYLTNEFKDFAKDILLSPQFINRGYFDMSYIKKLLKSCSTNNSYVGRQIWLLITLELWHRVFIDNDKIIA